MDVPTFIAQFPEFEQVNPALVSSTLARATRWVDPLVWGTLADDGVALLTAHWLSVSPFGLNTRMEPKPGTEYVSTYWTQFDEMRTAVATGVTVAGGAW